MTHDKQNKDNGTYIVEDSFNSTIGVSNSNSTMSSMNSSSVATYWPPWVEAVTCISHLLITLNSSVNFFIYRIKRKALNPGKFTNDLGYLNTIE